jgi:tetratricopeptide (TPR) repeat protein
MSNLHRPEDVAAYNENELEELAWAIEASVGQFKLFLARCNYTSLRSRLVERLQELTSVEIRVLELKTSEKTLYARIQAELDLQQPDALMVFGLESVDDLDELLSATNQVREEFRKNFHFPLVLWVNDEVLKKLLQLAPDFESWAITTDFMLATNELVDFLKKTAEQLFEGDLTLTLEACREIKLGCQDLPSREQVLDLELTAIIESLLGFTEDANYVNRNLDIALDHYQKGLELWQQSHNLERQGQLLREIAFCYYLKALRDREIDHPYWQSTRHYIRQCLEVFEQAQRPDLVANSILRLGRILRRLQDWEQLQTLAQKALQLHQTENRPIELAQDYGFLAEVALAKKHWIEAKEFAQKALDILSAVPCLESPNSSGVVYELPDNSVISYDPSRYWFILGQAQQHLDQPQEAIRNLEAAKRVGSPEDDTQLYLDTLCHLHKLYFEQKDYLKAFEIKLEQQSIEQQYGFRAFVGAGRIQPRRQSKLVLTQVESQETIAPAIEASGRQRDVERLIERIGRNDCKLSVIHGQSGVGKSSLMNGGLLPALKQKVIGTQETLPVLMRVYSSWIDELGQLLAEALLEKGISLLTPLDSEAAILEQLRQSEPRNLRTVLIFDQFEEFFFAYPLPAERRRFFEFLGKCLNILPVKVILSLREDYLHYLLECNRLPSMAIIGNDILTKHVLYQLRNFSPTDARSIIQKLTESSIDHLEPALIDKLVQDLTNESGEVRPIELQVLGAQLYEEGITTLKQYGQLAQPKLRRGKLSVLSCKEILLERWLERVIEDCGSLNKSFAWEILYSLTNETGTRPLKTKNELVRTLNTNFPSSSRKIHQVPDIFIPYGYNPEGGFSGQFRPAPTLTRTELLMDEREQGIMISLLEFSQKEQSPSSAKSRPKDTQLDLILEILVGSGLVLQLREEPEDRYQLVHDYLSTFIRQSQNFDMEERLVRSQEAKALREEQLNLEVRKLRTVISSLTTLCLVAFVIVVLSFLSTSSQLPSSKGLAYGALLWMGITAGVLFYSQWQMEK